ncbi:MAG: hypothetical protein JKY61_08660 [Planctomycetes bacterium]|nr:hypothetical protein [Planctomycetota bacterium]
MKIPTTVLATLCISLHLFGCGAESSPSSVEKPPQNTSAGTTTKWTVHAEMMVHLRTAEQAVAAFSPSEGANYPGLAANL